MHHPHVSPGADQVEIEISAPPPLVYQMLAAIGQGTQRPGERAVIMGRDGDTIIADFWSVARLPLGLSRTVRTRERVRLAPPDRIEYEHLDGPVRGLRESISVEPCGEHRTRVRYRGVYPASGAVSDMIFRRVTGPAVARTVAAHLADLRQRAEARAARSRVFADLMPTGPGLQAFNATLAHSEDPG